VGWIYRFYCLGGRDETNKAFRIILSLGLDDLYTNSYRTGGEMNRERAKELLPIIQAFAEGKTVQFQQIGMTGWMDDGDDVSFEISGEYRIKPEPREFYLYLQSESCGKWNKAGSMYVTEAGLKTMPTNAIKVREVLSDDD